MFNPALKSYIASTIRVIKFIPLFISFVFKYFSFKSSSKNESNRFSLSFNNAYPCLYENSSETVFDSHYIYHPAWAARILAETKPDSHIDISSTLSFCSMISAFVPVKFYDYRPPNLTLNNLEIDRADLTSLPFESRSIKSLSCMHVIEHVGLGRYGDEIDYNGDLKAINELKRVIAKDGDLLIVLPIGKESKIMFNAHRIYTFIQVLSYFIDFELKNFSLITDDNSYIESATKELADKQEYGCGCFWFKSF